jgi:hypothetical protein
MKARTSPSTATTSHKRRESGRSCRFPLSVSHDASLTCGDASCLTSCHLHFVSNSCPFFKSCIWGHFVKLCSSVSTPRKEGIASRDSDGSHGVPVTKVIDELLHSEPICLNHVVRERLSA